MTGEDLPPPHPHHGEGLDADEVAALLGITRGALDVRLYRTRVGTARIPFPEPDGAVYRDQQPVRCWWPATIEAYRLAWNAAGGSRRVFTDAQIAEIRRLHSVDGMGVNAIARRTGITTASVSRIVNNLAHTPKEQP